MCFWRGGVPPGVNDSYFPTKVVQGMCKCKVCNHEEELAPMWLSSSQYRV